jgi:hypothetical protein
MPAQLQPFTPRPFTPSSPADPSPPEVPCPQSTDRPTAAVPPQQRPYSAGRAVTHEVPKKGCPRHMPRWIEDGNQDNEICVPREKQRPSTAPSVAHQSGVNDRRQHGQPSLPLPQSSSPSSSFSSSSSSLSPNLYWNQSPLVHLQEGNEATLAKASLEFCLSVAHSCGLDAPQTTQTAQDSALGTPQEVLKAKQSQALLYLDRAQRAALAKVFVRYTSEVNAVNLAVMHRGTFFRSGFLFFEN